MRLKRPNQQNWNQWNKLMRPYTPTQMQGYLGTLGAFVDNHSSSRTIKNHLPEPSKEYLIAEIPSAIVFQLPSKGGKL